MAQRKTYSPEFKAKAALEVLQGMRTVNEIAADLGVHPVLLSSWKKQAVQNLADTFARPNKKADVDAEALQARLYQEIGQLKVELDWLKKKSGRLT